MKKVFVCLLLLSALVLSAADVNVTGKWTGTFDMTRPGGESRSSAALLVLKQTGTEITGTLGPNDDDQKTIQKGKIEGGKIALEVTDGDRTIQFRLVVDGDRMTGDAKATRDGETQTAKLDVTRAK